MVKGRARTGNLPTIGTPRSGGPRARTRIGVTALGGACIGVLAAVPGNWELGTLVGWDVTAFAYVCWTLAMVWRLDAEAASRLAVREDPGRAAIDVVILSAAVASLLAIAVVMAAGHSGAGEKEFQAALALVSVVLSWAVVHTVFMLRYARLYYTGPDGGIDFNQDEPPRYSDFTYLAFTIGMTFQVSDTEFTDAVMRATGLRHALLSYLMGSVILAAIINLIAGLAR